MALELKDLATRTIGKAVGRQHGLLLNFTKAPSNPIASLLLEAVPAFLLSSFGINDRAALARERNGYEEWAEAEGAGIALGFRQPSLVVLLLSVAGGC